eukprot:8095581-Lingulodinium_polyedra.AAC.1
MAIAWPSRGQQIDGTSGTRNANDMTGPYDMNGTIGARGLRHVNGANNTNGINGINGKRGATGM